jgi:hypothetical protein
MESRKPTFKCQYDVADTAISYVVQIANVNIIIMEMSLSVISIGIN